MTTNTNPFTFVDAIYRGENIITDDDSVKDYLPFIINRTLSYQKDCILYAQEMNLRPHLSKKMQFAYFLGTIRAHKRYGTKWVKKIEDSTISQIKEYYGYSEQKARDVLEILTPAAIAAIIKANERGEFIKHK